MAAAAAAVPSFSQGSGTALALRRLGGRGLLRVVKALLLQRRVVIAGKNAAFALCFHRLRG